MFSNQLNTQQQTGSPIPRNSWKATLGAMPKSPNSALATTPPGAKPLTPLEKLGFNTMHDSGTDQFGGAGVLKSPNGRVRFWDGTQPSDVAPRTQFGSVAEWQANEASRRMRTQPMGNQGTQMVSTGTPSPLAPLRSNAALQAQPATKQSPLMTATGLSLPANLPATEANRRTDAMMQKQVRNLGPLGTLAGMQLGSGLQMHAADNQLKQQQQAGKLSSTQQAQVELMAKALGNENLSDQHLGLLGQMHSMLGGNQGTQGSNPYASLMTGERVRLPSLEGKTKSDQIAAFADWAAHPENANLTAAKKAQMQAQLGITNEDIARYQIESRPGMLSIKPGSVLNSLANALNPQRQVQLEAAKRREEALNKSAPGAAGLAPKPFDFHIPVPSASELHRFFRAQQLSESGQYNRKAPGAPVGR